MSAITPYLDELMERDLDEEDAGDDFFNCGSGGQALNGLGGRRSKACKPPAVVVADTHKSQAFTLYIRQVAAAVLARPGRTLQPAFDGRYAVLLINPIITDDEAPPWSPLGEDAVRGKVNILANVSKMGCPSFSLPAGSGTFLGTCPGAVHGMTVEKPNTLTSIQPKQRIAQTVGMEVPADPNVWYASAVCQHCYAVKKSYAYFSKQLATMAVYAWTKTAVANGTFVNTMIEAIERSPFHQDRPEDRRHLEPFGYKRVFRLHDSGDFFSKEYAAAWKQIADHFNPYAGGTGTPTIFWAPTRLWAGGSTVRNYVSVFGPAGDLRTNNMVIRPSAFHTNAPAPTPIVGEVAGSTVHSVERSEEPALIERGVFKYVCPASRAEAKEKTCLQVIGPDGDMGCRACWVRTNDIISYHIH